MAPNEVLGSGPLQGMKGLHCALRLLNRHKEMVVMHTGNHIAADSGLRERLSKCGSQADGCKVGVNGESDPSRGKCDRQIQIQGGLLCEDHRKPFRFTD